MTKEVKVTDFLKKKKSSRYKTVQFIQN